MNQQRPRIEEIAQEITEQRNGALDGLAMAGAMLKAEQRAKTAAFEALDKALVFARMMHDVEKALVAGVPGLGEWRVAKYAPNPVPSFLNPADLKSAAPADPIEPN